MLFYDKDGLEVAVGDTVGLQPYLARAEMYGTVTALPSEHSPDACIRITSPQRPYVLSETVYTKPNTLRLVGVEKICATLAKAYNMTREQYEKHTAKMADLCEEIAEDDEY